MTRSKMLAAAAVAALATLGFAGVSQAGISLSGTVTYYNDFTENSGADITFSSPFASQTFTTISDTADYGGTNSQSEWINGNTLYGADFVGTITAPSTGTYEFNFGVDDAAYLFVNGSSSPVAFISGGNDFLSSGAPRIIDVALNSGANSFEIQYANEFQTQAALEFAAVPEPATWAMMLVGFGGLGAAMRSRRKAAALA